ncbi:MAG: hypothetical protein ACYTGZ_04715 [Planctomycetota bacterium]|jgi:hypothetical protein
MSRILLTAVLLCVALPAAPAVAKGSGKGKAKTEKKADVLKETVKQINEALSKKDATAAKAAFARAKGIQPNYESKKLGPVVNAIGKGVAHKDPVIALAAVDTLGAMRVKGSSKSLGKLISPPAKVTLDRVLLHVAAIAAAGLIHDKESQKPLAKAMLHTNKEIAVAAANAFAGFGSIDPKPRKALMKSLIKALGDLEKKAKSGRKEEDKERAKAVAEALNNSLAALAGSKGPTTSKEWSAWLKQQAKVDS